MGILVCELEYCWCFDWTWANFRRWWGAGRPGMLQPMWDCMGPTEPDTTEQLDSSAVCPPSVLCPSCSARCPLLGVERRGCLCGPLLVSSSRWAAVCRDSTKDVVKVFLCLLSFLFVSASLQPLLEFSRPEYWSVLPFPSPGDLPSPGVEPRSPTLQADSLPSEPLGKPRNTGVGSLCLHQWICLTQESNQGLLHCRWILYQLGYQRS